MGLLARLAVPAPVQAGWGVAKGVARAIPWQLYAAVAVALLLVAIHHAGVVSGRAEVQKAFDEHLTYDQIDEEAAIQARAQKEQSDRAAFEQALLDYQEDTRDARTKETAVADGVRSGAIRLRPQWACPARDLPGPAAGAETADAGAELRAADSGRLVRIGAQADAQVRGLQAVLAAERAKPIAR